jgi:formamidopyrimidine-DNA glycosylase
VPELPDISVYVERLNALVAGQTLNAVRVNNAFLLRSVEPPLTALAGKKLVAATRMGKRIVLKFENDIHAIIHLMIAGRLRWRANKSKSTSKKAANNLAEFDFELGRLLLTEAGKKRRASLHLIAQESDLSAFDRGGLEISEIEFEAFRQRLSEENHTLKRALTDQRILSGIGNAYSDEILHRARMSPFTQTRTLNQEQAQQLFDACKTVLDDWTMKLRSAVGDGFPEKVTAFHDDMAVHGRYRQPCPDCGSPVQRIRYADNESNYCAHCQTGGKLYADRALSRLLKSNWPKTVDELDGV